MTGVGWVDLGGGETGDSGANHTLSPFPGLIHEHGDVHSCTSTLAGISLNCPIGPAGAYLQLDKWRPPLCKIAVQNAMWPAPVPLHCCTGISAGLGC